MPGSLDFRSDQTDRFEPSSIYHDRRGKTIPRPFLRKKYKMDSLFSCSSCLFFLCVLGRLGGSFFFALSFSLAEMALGREKIA
jgi:hypothetical protein